MKEYPKSELIKLDMHDKNAKLFCSFLVPESIGLIIIFLSAPEAELPSSGDDNLIGLRKIGLESPPEGDNTILSHLIKRG